MADGSEILRPRDPGSLDQSAMAQDVGLVQAAERTSPFLEMGATGLRRAAGYIDEEFLPQLRGRKAIEVFKEMSLNDPICSSLLFTIDRLLRNVDWNVQPAGKSAEVAKAARFVEGCMEDMDDTWSDFISEALSMLPYGWSYHEMVFKRRRGMWQRDGKFRSKFDDDLIGVRKLPIRAQDTLLRWVFDSSGETAGMVQIAPPLYKTVFVPINRSVLFRYRHYKNSPEGLSMLRGAYRPYFFKKRIEEFEAIGIERDLAGLPIAKIPAEMLRATPGSEQAKSADAFKRLVRSMRRNDQEGIVFPMSYDQETKQPLYSLELLGGGGARQFDTNAVIERYEQRMLMTVLADFILVGHEDSGSYSLHTDKTGIFRTALNSISESIADTLNRVLIPKLFMVNGWKPASLPKIVPTDVDAPDITVLSAFMSQMSAMGVQWFPDGELENFLRNAARLPELDEEQLETRRQMQMRAEATQFAQANFEYVSTQANLHEAMTGQPVPGQDPNAANSTQGGGAPAQGGRPRIGAK